jgi:hypothetical protein
MTYIAELFIKTSTIEPEFKNVLIRHHIDNRVMHHKFILDVEDLEALEDEIEAMLDEIRDYRKRNNIVYGE